jgi:hypothetical protein
MRATKKLELATAKSLTEDKDNAAKTARGATGGYLLYLCL